MAEYGNHLIRKISSVGIISTVAGKGAGDYSGDGGPPSQAGLNRADDVTIDASGILYRECWGQSVQTSSLFCFVSFVNNIQYPFKPAVLKNVPS